ncbi:MAG: hypothetical protein II808_04035 [Clostridia bacterium]|nr:hypothetical protein [Clostridia bacterium]
MNTALYSQLYAANDMSNKLEESRTNFELWKKEADKYNRKIAKGRNAVLWICVIAAIIVNIVVFFAALNKKDAGAMVLTTFLISAAVCVALPLAMHFILKAVYKKKIADTRAKADEWSEHWKKIYNPSLLAFLPENYRYPIAINYMANIVYSDRAQTLNEALNKYDEQLHRWKMENTQEAILAEQQFQTRQLSDIHTAAVATAVGVWRN